MTKEIKLHTGNVAIVDDCDADLAEYHWSELRSYYTSYAQRVIRGSKPYKNISMHREIMNRVHGSIPEGMEVDHIDHDGLNNTRGNLRIVTRSQNSKNKRPNWGELCAARNDMVRKFNLGRIGREELLAFLKSQHQ